MRYVEDGFKFTEDLEKSMVQFERKALLRIKVAS
jgi:hypothetical protein